MSQVQAGLEIILRAAPVVPVVVIDDIETAVPLARALVAGGLPVIEVTLRTPAAWEAIRRMLGEVAGAIVGVGTVLHHVQLREAVATGAKFAVSPGATDSLLDEAAQCAIPLLPGIATASEAMCLIARSYQFAKFFPAEPAGGVAYLSALGSPLPQLQFCPTGGINLASAPEYLKLKNVICVGGSWMLDRAHIASGDWPRIEAASRQAAALHG
ncbi:MAG: keto-deoxy-phosphogluconate aldolase [Rhodospirillales bacterium 20-60-12]|nr:MAG: keto-deoxy-phosphogluconate aldolase [Rhodospirillales bacterium 20-60-12]HQT66168.1 bifunctional 4-hydroxy-2-oxoglutarate aldolase/2-dehydro-3-deoxy-phosphogluconate aldolase [Acetobacteraceae bacterium]HQU01766.1 bifunctional 4-hydroxy-2-oxoglutarate aldolase/2-dehydro-3-deoxy-phosphogluconate aldolase [Acetobacteraceae bacterium]